MMKKMVIAFSMLSLLSAVVGASQPTDIRFMHKESTFFGQKYSIYMVRCSNGSSGKISSWEEGKKWCVGTSRSTCAENKGAQLEIAKKSCG
ncbi:MAG: hypothetical protein PHP00_03775 [Thiotrichaceae bacterium]|nr:hypothetical protein [Thiotrichaceae bacterium]